MRKPFALTMSVATISAALLCANARAAQSPKPILPPSLREVLRYWHGSSAEYAFPAHSQFRRFNAIVLFNTGDGRSVAVVSRQGRQFRMLLAMRSCTSYIASNGGYGHTRHGTAGGNSESKAVSYFAAFLKSNTRNIGFLSAPGAPAYLFVGYSSRIKSVDVSWGSWDKPGPQACIIRLGRRWFDGVGRHGRIFRFDPRTQAISVESASKGFRYKWRVGFAAMRALDGERQVVPAFLSFSKFDSAGGRLGSVWCRLVANAPAPLLPERHRLGGPRLAGLRAKKVSYARLVRACEPAPGSHLAAGHPLARERRFVTWAAGKKLGRRIVRWVNDGPWKSGAASAIGGAGK